MKDQIDRRSFLKIAGASLGIGVLSSVSCDESGDLPPARLRHRVVFFREVTALRRFTQYQ